jgi:hypothetical protein
MVAHAFNTNTWEAEAGGFLSSRPAWSTAWFQDSQGYTEKPCLENQKTKKQTNKNEQFFHNLICKYQNIISSHHCFDYIKNKYLPGVVAHTFNPSTWETEAGRFLSSRPAWSTKLVPGQPGLYRETLS